MAKSYTNRDIVDIRSALIDSVPNLTDKWRDFNESDLGVAIIELISGVADMQNFYFDTQAFETYLDTAVQEKNIRNIISVMNYKIPLRTSAEGDVVLWFGNDEYKNVNIPKNTVFTCSSNNIKYISTDDVVASGEIDNVTVHVVQGERVNIKVTKEQLSNRKTSSGLISRRYYLEEAVASGYTEILQEGESWVEVEDALLEYWGGRKFSLHRDSNNKCYILFTSNFLDMLSDYEEITISYVRTLGTAGAVKEYEIDGIQIGVTGLESVSNTYDTYGASDDIDLNEAKVLARRKARTMDRFITLEDYETGVLEEGFVKWCVVKDWKTPEYVSEPFLVKIWAVDSLGRSIWDSDETEASSFREKLERKFREKGVAAIKVELAPVEFIEFSIVATIKTATQSTAEENSIKNGLINCLREKFGLNSIGFGKSISYGDVYYTIRNYSNKIVDAKIESPLREVTTTEVQLPKLISVSVEIEK